MNKSFNTFALAVCGVLLISFLGSCGSSSHHPIAVALNASQGTVDEGGQVTLTASVTNDSKNAGVTFGSPQPKVAGGCSGSGTASGQCGTVTQTSATSATYTAPATPVAVVVTATSKTDSSKSITITITINKQPTIAATITATIGQACPTLVSDGTPPYTLTANLPSWATFNTSTGVICAGNVPTSATTSSVTVTKLTDSGGYSSSSQTSVNITVPIVVATNAALPAGEVSQTAYSGVLTAQGGSGTYTAWTVTTGSLPPGLAISGTSTGLISGAPTAACNACGFTVQAKDSLGATGTKQFSLTINARVAVTQSGALPGATLGNLYGTTLTATSGVAPYSGWVVSSGSLPAGLALNSGTGVISGTLGAGSGGTETFSVTVKDSLNVVSAPADLSITVTVTPLSITTTSLPNVTVGTLYDQLIQTSGGDETGVTYAVASGTLPAWATLTSAGHITGTPAAANVGTSAPFTISATQSGSTVTSPSLTITVVANSACPSGGAKANLLSGNYALRFQGIDSDNIGFIAAVGMFHADGVSAITSGVLEFNGTAAGNSTNGTPIPVTGCFVVNADQTGTMTFVNSTAQVNATVAIAIQADGHAGRAITFDTTSGRLSGNFESQNATAFANANISGDYAFGFDGFTTGTPGNIAAVARFHADGAGSVSNGNIDIETSNGLSTPSTTGAALTSASYSVVDAATGRTTLNFTVNDTYGAQAFNLACYIADVTSGVSNTLYCMGLNTPTSAMPLLSGRILTQDTPSGGFTNTNSAPASNASVMSSSGIDSSGTPRVAIGQLTYNTSANPATVAISQDLNKGGSGVSFQTITENISVASNGRMVASVSGLNVAICYMLAPGKAFCLDQENNASLVFVEPQEAKPTGGFTVSNLHGTYAVGTVDPMIDPSQGGVSDFTGVFTTSLNSGTSYLSGPESVNSTTGLSSPSFNSTYTVLDSTIGRVQVSVTGPHTDTWILYIINSTTAVAVSDLSDTAHTQPVVIYFNQ